MKIKYLIFACVVILTVIYNPNKSYAKFIIFSWGGGTVEKIADFPDTEYFKVNNDYIDAGYCYKEITVFFIPLFQYDFEWCGYIPESSSYYSYSKSQIFEFAQMASISLPDHLELSFWTVSAELNFWTAWGGKSVLALILVMVILYHYFNSKVDETDQPVKIEYQNSPVTAFISTRNKEQNIKKIGDDVGHRTSRSKHSSVDNFLSGKNKEQGIDKEVKPTDAERTKPQITPVKPIVTFPKQVDSNNIYENKNLTSESISPIPETHSGTSMSYEEEELKKVEILYNRNVISEEERIAMRAKILGIS
jgi:hypothetical protein